MSMLKWPTSVEMRKPMPTVGVPKNSATIAPISAGANTAPIAVPGVSTTPVAVLVTAANTTAGATTNLDVGALNLSKAGFSIYAAGQPGTSATYLINYMVLRDPH